MSNSSSGIPLPSRDAQEFAPGRPWPPLPSQQTDAANSKASLALAILSEKIKSGVIRRTELMRRIVAQALAATGAKGVALALRSHPGGRVVCCASEGDMAPPPGTPLDETSGFTAECLRKGSFIVCEDSETDVRVDRVACMRLGVRSIVAVPVENEGGTVGILEALSDQVAAFSKQHIEVLLTLACFAKSVAGPTSADVHPQIARMELATAVVEAPALPSQAKTVATDVLAKVEDSLSWAERVPRRVRLAIAAGVAAALLLAFFATVIWLWMWRQNAKVEVGKASNPQSQQAFPSKPSAGLGVNPPSHGFARPGGGAERKPLVSKASAVEKIQISEVQRVTAESEAPPAPEDEAMAPAAFTPLTKTNTTELTRVLASANTLPSVSLATSQGVVPARLQHRVEPIYPAEAKRTRIEGAVVLRAALDEAGKVKSVAVVNGNPLLATAAVAAVRQWRYSPAQLSHHATASNTDITIVFHLQ